MTGGESPRAAGPGGRDPAGASTEERSARGRRARRRTAVRRHVAARAGAAECAAPRRQFGGEATAAYPTPVTGVSDGRLHPAPANAGPCSRGTIARNLGPPPDLPTPEHARVETSPRVVALREPAPAGVTRTLGAAHQRYHAGPAPVQAAPRGEPSRGSWAGSGAHSLRDSVAERRPDRDAEQK